MSVEQFSFHHEGLELVFSHSPDRPVALIKFSSGFDIVEEKYWHCFPIVELQVGGEDQIPRPMGQHYCGTEPGTGLRYLQHNVDETQDGKRLTITQSYGALNVTTYFCFYDGLTAFRSWSEVNNTSTEAVELEYLSSLCLTGFLRVDDPSYDKDHRLWVPFNSQLCECRWQDNPLSSWGFTTLCESTQRIAIGAHGAHNTNNYLPMGVLQNLPRQESYFWQIEQQGAWSWELCTNGYFLTLHTSGPTFRESQWYKVLKTGQSFSTPKTSFGYCPGDIENAFQDLTAIRRKISRSSWDKEKCPVIFNDYMNCLHGNPSEEKLIPLIDKAAEVGCEIFCIDCGWYTPLKGSWSRQIGDWEVNNDRFPNGIEKVLGYIRDKGMIPGLWIEPEVLGIDNKASAELPDECFFMRRGKRVKSRGRYHLDFRHPLVIQRMNGLIQRIVEQWKVGYIKVDFNSDPAPGTDCHADSPGEGLQEHYHAYLEWIDSIFAKYPDLVMENCGSGGLRMNYALLSRHSIQSSSDQTNYDKFAYIAAAASTAVAPEQLAVWSYPLPGQSENETVFNMVNSILGRIHLSGKISELSEQQLSLVSKAIDVYKSFRQQIHNAKPVWPLGLPRHPSEHLVYGWIGDKALYLSLWNFGASGGKLQMNLQKYLDQMDSPSRCVCLYPERGVEASFNEKKNGHLDIEFKESNSAVLLKIS